MTQLRRIPPDDADRSPRPRLAVLGPGGQVMTCQGPFPWCLVLDPSLVPSVGLGPHQHHSQWDIVLGDSKATTMAYLSLEYGTVHRTLIFNLQCHHALLRAIWLERRLAIRGRDGCPAVLVYDIPRSGLETVLQYTVVLDAEQAVTPN